MAGRDASKLQLCAKAKMDAITSASFVQVHCKKIKGKDCIQLDIDVSDALLSEGSQFSCVAAQE